MFEVDIAAEKCSNMKYQMVMETDDRWDVTVHIYVWFSDGTKKRVAATGTLVFGRKRRDNVIYFSTC